MLIVGERINTTRKAMSEAVAGRRAEPVKEEAARQIEAGADTLDVNCGTVPAETEPETLAWLVEIVQAACDLPLCIDSPNPKALAAGLSVHRGKAMINSISGEKARYEQVLPLVKQYGASVVALGVDDRGIPEGRDRATEVASGLVSALLAEGVAADDIYFDPLVRSVATSQTAALESLALMRDLGVRFPGLHFISGLSNASYGLPERRHLNRAFAVLSIAAGLDAVIMDPLDATLVALIYATEVLANQDRFCMRYIDAFHRGRLKA
jgi:5-methyltetrahydrofolate--homocysteine methyltransferase